MRNISELTTLASVIYLSLSCTLTKTESKIPVVEITPEGDELLLKPIEEVLKKPKEISSQNMGDYIADRFKKIERDKEEKYVFSLHFKNDTKPSHSFDCFYDASEYCKKGTNKPEFKEYIECTYRINGDEAIEVEIKDFKPFGDVDQITIHQYDNTSSKPILNIDPRISQVQSLVQDLYPPILWIVHDKLKKHGRKKGTSWKDTPLDWIEKPNEKLQNIQKKLMEIVEKEGSLLSPESGTFLHLCN